MTAATGKRMEIGLVLQGGGALGAYEYGGITALLKLMETAKANGRDIVLKVVTGVSIGASTRRVWSAPRTGKMRAAGSTPCGVTL